MKILIAILPLIFSAQAATASYLPEDIYKNIKCQKELQSHLGSLFSKDPKWERTVDTSFDTQAFRASEKIGEWYELRVTEGKPPAINFVSTKKGTEYSWSESCALATKTLSGFEFFKQSKKNLIDNFSDEDLVQTLQTNKTGVIYVWSPRMVYSVTEFFRVRALVQKKGYEFIPVLDHSATVQEAKDAMKTLGGELKLHVASLQREPSSVGPYKKLNSVELYMRNSSLHFPVIYMYSKGQLHPRRIVGVLTDKGLDLAMTEWLGELK